MEFQNTWRLVKSGLVLFSSLVVLCQFGLSQEGREEARSHVKYTTATICGNYSAIATYGANIARALGTETFDGQGGLSGSAIVNQPGPNNTRTITSIGLAGTYTVNPDGTGKMVLTVTLPGGASSSVTEDFLITKVKSIGGLTIASEIQDAQEVPSAVIEDSSLVIHSYSLRSTPRSCRTGP